MERFEDTGALFRRDPNTGIFNCEIQHHAAGFGSYQRNLKQDLSPFRELDRVPYQIDENLAQPRGVSDEFRGHLFGNEIYELELFFRTAFGEHITQFGDRLARIERYGGQLKLAGFN